MTVYDRATRKVYRKESLIRGTHRAPLAADNIRSDEIILQKKFRISEESAERIPRKLVLRMLNTFPGSELHPVEIL